MDNYLIWLHAGLGGLALLSGMVALFTTKGSPPHRLSGKAFFMAMLGSALLGAVVAVLPGHVSPFLFAIALFSLYLILSGFRATRYHRPGWSPLTDRLLAYVMAGTGLLMIAYPPLFWGSINIVLAVFGMIGLFLSVGDLRILAQPEKAREEWLRTHLTKMTGGYIAAFTAFLVVNQFLPGLIAWFAPTVIGTTFIIFQIRRTRRLKKSTYGR